MSMITRPWFLPVVILAVLAGSAVLIRVLLPFSPEHPIEKTGDPIVDHVHVWAAAVVSHDSRRRNELEAVMLKQPDSYLPAVLDKMTRKWEEERIRIRATRLLGLFKKVEALPPLLLRLQEDRSARVRANAAWALGELGQGIVIPNLEEAYKTDADSDVREEARNALAKIRSPKK